MFGARRMPARRSDVTRLLKAALTLAVLVLSVNPLFAQQVTVIRASRIIDGTGTPPIEDGAVVITGDSITGVGKASTVTVPAGARVIDLKGYTLLPGLIDCHTHITGMPGDGGDTSELKETDEQRTIYGVVNGKITLEAGFTTIRNVGGGGYGTVALRDSINKGLIAGPRIYTAAKSLGMTGGHGDINGWSADIALPGTAEIVDGVEALQKAVRQQIKFGADLIKVVASGGILSVGDSPTDQQYSFEELKAVVDEAARSGRKVAAHAHGAAGIKNAVRAGVASIEHGSLIDDEAIQLMKQHGTVLVPTLYTLDFMLEEGPAHGVPDYALQKARRMRIAQRENLKRAYQAGVKFAYGTDAAVIPHGRNARDFNILVSELGVTPLDAIKMATSSAAELIGIAERVGTLRPGLWADVVAVEGNPASDIRLLEQVKFVMKGGIVYKSVSAPGTTSQP
jgi:imidazolonepropionase-like amidohydrolase